MVPRGRERATLLGGSPQGRADTGLCQYLVLTSDVRVLRLPTTQRPATASGVTFINLGDETGMINVIVSPGCFIRSKRTVTSSAALIIRGRVERSKGVTNLVADTIERIPGRQNDLPRVPLNPQVYPGG